MATSRTNRIAYLHEAQLAHEQLILCCRLFSTAIDAICGLEDNRTEAVQELISSSSSSLSFLPAAALSVSLVSPSLGWLEAKIRTLCKTKQKYSAAQMNLVVEMCNKVGVEGALLQGCSCIGRFL